MKLIRYKRRIKNYYSEIKSKQLLWLTTLFVVSSIAWITLLVVQILSYIHLTPPEMYSITVGSAYALIAYVTTTLLLKQSEIINQNSEMVKELTRNASINIDQYHLIIDKLNRYVTQNETYKDPELTITELGKKVDVQAYQLSRAINFVLGKNFHTYINEFRINEAKQHLLKEEDRTILEVAYASGFNSKSTFNEIFKKMTGSTPTDFKKIQYTNSADINSNYSYNK